MTISICFTYFRSLALANLRAALFSVRRQDLTSVKELIVIDNNTSDTQAEIHTVVDDQAFPMPVHLHSMKHEEASRTHSWSTNIAVKHATAPWILFCRADYILDFTMLSRFIAVLEAHPPDWDGFVTANVYHLNSDIAACEQTAWREQGVSVLRSLSGAEADYTKIDAGVWLARRDAFNRVHGLHEGLTAWGHAQTHFQYKLHATGTEFVRIPEVLFYHPQHAGHRDLAEAHAQLAAAGADLRELWQRYEGRSPY